MCSAGSHALSSPNKSTQPSCQEFEEEDGVIVSESLHVNSDFLAYSSK